MTEDFLGLYTEIILPIYRIYLESVFNKITTLSDVFIKLKIHAINDNFYLLVSDNSRGAREHKR